MVYIVRGVSKIDPQFGATLGVYDREPISRRLGLPSSDNCCRSMPECFVEPQAELREHRGFVFAAAKLHFFTDQDCGVDMYLGLAHSMDVNIQEWQRRLGLIAVLCRVFILDGHAGGNPPAVFQAIPVFGPDSRTEPSASSFAAKRHPDGLCD